MISQSHSLRLVILIAFVFYLFGCKDNSQEIPQKFKPYISQITVPVEYKEILPFHNDQRLPIPESISNNQALEDIQMLEYLLSTSYSGFDNNHIHENQYTSYSLAAVIIAWRFSILPLSTLAPPERI